MAVLNHPPVVRIVRQQQAFDCVCVSLILDLLRPLRFFLVDFR